MFNVYWTKKFSDIFPSYEDFLDYYTNDIPNVMKEYQITKNNITSTKSYVTDYGLELTYYLLSTNYKNSSIANMDETQFKLKLFGTIFQYGPIWEKRLNIQNELRNLTADEIKSGSGALYNHVFNNGTEVEDVNEELLNLNEQNTTKYRKGPVEAYTMLYETLGQDVSKYYMDKFKKLFIVIVTGQEPLLYGTDISGEEE